MWKGEDCDTTLTADSVAASNASGVAVSRRAGRYELGEPLGAGAMGIVYRARDPELDRDIAIKLVRVDSPGTASRARLLREAQALARLRHPNVLPIFDVGLAEGTVFLAMPLLEGGTLRRWLRAAPRSAAAILDRFVAAGAGLAAAHAARLVHRDFKPDNVLLGDDDEVRVADFGLARLAGDQPIARASGTSPGSLATQTDDVVGTPPYMAPEQLRGGPSDARADQFSFCVALWEGLYGQRPFPSPPPGVPGGLRARLDGIAAGPRAVSRRRDRPAWIVPLLQRGLADHADARWPTMQALLDAIAARRARRWPRRVAVGVGAAGLAVAVAALVRPPPPAAQPHGEPPTQAAVSPDGTKLAVLTGRVLAVRGIGSSTDERVVARNIDDMPIAWSPDGRSLVATAYPKVIGQREIVLIDVDGGDQHKVASGELATFLSPGEVAVTAPRRRSVEIVQAAPHGAHLATCDVPGDYTFLLNVVGLGDGTMIVDLGKGETHAVAIIRRDCRVRATFSAEPLASIVASDDGTVVALADHDGFGEILEISLDGDVVSRRQVAPEVTRVIGRRHGVDYVAAEVLETRLDRIDHETRVPLLVIHGRASFSLAPDGDTLAWADLGASGHTAMRLLLLDLREPARGSREVLDHAWGVSWSPDGRSLAVLIDDDTPGGPGQPVRIVVIDRSGTVLYRLPAAHLDRGAAPIWLDDHRIAGQSEDRTTYRWFDVTTGDQGDLVDRTHGSTYSLVRSPHDGALAMWRNGPPGQIDDHTDHLWLREPGREARPLHVDAAHQSFLVPSWTPAGDLLVREPLTGDVSRVSLQTGELTPVLHLPPAAHRPYDDHLMILADGTMLAVDYERSFTVSAVDPADERRRTPPVGNPL